MKILPFEEFFIKSSLNSEKVIIRLKEELESPNLNFVEANNNYFEIKEKMSGNSFSPIIEGEICKDVGTIIKIKVRVRYSTEVLLMAILIFSIVALMFFVVSLIYYSKFETLYIVPLTIAVGSYFIGILAFKFEAYKVKKKLMRMFS